MVMTMMMMILIMVMMMMMVIVEVKTMMLIDLHLVHKFFLNFHIFNYCLDFARWERMRSGDKT